MRVLVSFIDDESNFIGPWHEIEGARPPAVGELVTLAQDGQRAELNFKAADVRHTIHRSIDGEFSQMIDVVLVQVRQDA